MSARVTRRAITTGARSSVLKPRFAPRVMRRNASTSSHEPELSSDKPWLIGSLLIFGPAFLYLLSPSAKKSHHVEHEHKDGHGHSKGKEVKTLEPLPESESKSNVEVKDADDVSTESSDVSIDAQPSEKSAEVVEEEPSKPIEQESTDVSTIPNEEVNGENPEKTQSAGGEEKSSEKATDVGEAREAAVVHKPADGGAKHKN